MTSGNDAWSRVDKSVLATRFATEFGPALVFVVALQAAGLVLATGLFVAAIAAATLYSWRAQGHFPRVPAATFLLAAIFGGLTIWRDQAAYIELRATVVNGAAAIAIIGGLATGHLVLKGALQAGFRLTDRAWRRLSVRTAIYFIVLAVLNEIVRRNFSTETWSFFKAAIPVLNVAYLGCNWPLIRDNLVDEDADGQAASRSTSAAGASAGARSAAGGASDGV